LPQINLEEYRNPGKKSKKSAGDEYEERAHAGERQFCARKNGGKKWRENGGKTK